PREARDPGGGRDPRRRVPVRAGAPDAPGRALPPARRAVRRLGRLPPRARRPSAPGRAARWVRGPTRVPGPLDLRPQRPRVTRCAHEPPPARGLPRALTALAILPPWPSG